MKWAGTFCVQSCRSGPQARQIHEHVTNLCVGSADPTYLTYLTINWAVTEH